MSGAPLYAAICHCLTCRRASAAPAVAWVTFDRQLFALLQGSPRTYRSSPGVQRTFCERCGTPLTYASEQRPGHIDITTLSLDEPERFAPNSEVWLEQRVAWMAVDPARRQFPRGGE